MENDFFTAIKQFLQEDKQRYGKIMQKIYIGENETAFSNINEAVEALKKGQFVVGFSFDIMDGDLGIFFDNAYRLDKNRFYSYTFIPNTKRPFKILPLQGAMLPMCASEKFVDDFIRDWIDSLHHGFILGDEGMLDFKHLPKCLMDEISNE